MPFPKDRLDALRTLLHSVNVDDGMISRGVRLTKQGKEKVAKRFGVSTADVDNMLNDLAAQPLNEDTDRYTYEKDALGNISVRDAQTGMEKFIRGDAAFQLTRRLTREPGLEDKILAGVFGEDELMEFAPSGSPEDTSADSIVSNQGTFNFPYKGKFATAVYGLDLNGQFVLNVESLRDANGDNVEIDPSMKDDLNKIAMKWVDKV